MFETQPTWMRQNQNPVCSTQDIVVRSSHSKSSGWVFNADGTLGIVNVPSSPLNCSNEQATHDLQSRSPSLDHYSGISNWPNNQLLTTTASSDTSHLQHPVASSQELAKSPSSEKESHFYGCSGGSMKNIPNLSSVFGNKPAIEDTQNSTILPQDYETLIERKIRCTNSNSKSENNTFLKTKRKRKTVAKVKDDKYWERRKRNNLAAKKSRDAKREKEQSTEMRLSCLEIENRRLRLEVSCLLEQNKNFKQIIGLI